MNWLFGGRNARPTEPKPPKGYSKNGKKIGRPTNEVRAQKRRDALADKKTEIELRRMEREIKHLEGNDDEPLDMDTVKRVIRYLRYEWGLVLVPKNGRAPVDDGGIVRELLEVALPVVRQTLPMLTGGAPAVSAPAIAPPAAAPVSPAQPAAAATSASISPAPAPAAPIGDPLSIFDWKTRFKLNALSAMGPQDAATQILSTDDENARQWLEVLRLVPPEHLWQALDEIAATPSATTGQISPEACAMVAWFKQRREWTEQLAAELRIRLGTTAPAAAAPTSQGG